MSLCVWHHMSATATVAAAAALHRIYIPQAKDVRFPCPVVFPISYGSRQWIRHHQSPPPNHKLRFPPCHQCRPTLPPSSITMALAPPTPYRSPMSTASHSHSLKPDDLLPLPLPPPSHPQTQPRTLNLNSTVFIGGVGAGEEGVTGEKEHEL
ncbi:Os03g0430050 [Oryza sativa Japonica Group]|uniref:Os03g0430050 protein n=1 Tax=Oryza sativa subsp. japonica TaxID=39947 RepID=A0A0N7KHH2_ORYSJ|nr:Os03g0430050 [Oryza sativa Japonica Group]